MSLRIQKNVAVMTAEQHQRRWQAWNEAYNKAPLALRRGCRVGTITCTLQDFARLTGNPHDLGSPDDKITAAWWFATPRGPVQVSDYWWNRKDELSIRSADARAMRWFIRWCRLHGFVTPNYEHGPRLRKEVLL